MKINPQIYREYDIRGVVDKDLTPEVVKKLGQGFGTQMVNLGRKELVVGRDGRLSSKPFSEALIQGILSTGCNVVDIGLCPTPVYYFSLFHFDKDGYINSGGIAILIGIASESRKNEQTIRMTGLSSHFQKIFNMVGLTKYTEIFPTEELALKEF